LGRKKDTQTNPTGKRDMNWGSIGFAQARTTYADADTICPPARPNAGMAVKGKHLKKKRFHR